MAGAGVPGGAAQRPMVSRSGPVAGLDPAAWAVAPGWACVALGSSRVTLIVVIGAVAYLFDLLMRYVERVVVPWKGKI